MQLYRITNILNGKTYIGISIRDKASYFGSGVGIKSAIRKYGKENFKKEILKSDFTSLEELKKAEIESIAREKTDNIFGVYNMHVGGCMGEGMKGKTHEDVYGKEKAEIISKKVSETLKIKGIKPPSRKGTRIANGHKLIVSESSRNRIWKQESKAKVQNNQPHRKEIYCVTNNTIYTSINEAAKKLSLNLGNVSEVVSGKRGHTKGYVFRRADA